MSAELKPCPFCGVEQTDHDFDSSWVRCLGCGAESGWGSPAEAVAAWNRRADLAPTLPSADYVAVPKSGQNLMEVALWTELREAMIKDRPDQLKPPMALGPNATAVIKRTIADYLDALAARHGQSAAWAWDADGFLQPAADVAQDEQTRLVPLQTLNNWQVIAESHGLYLAEDIRVIIDGETGK